MPFKTIFLKLVLFSVSQLVVVITRTIYLTNQELKRKQYYFLHSVKLTGCPIHGVFLLIGSIFHQLIALRFPKWNVLMEWMLNVDCKNPFALALRVIYRRQETNAWISNDYNCNAATIKCRYVLRMRRSVDSREFAT